MIIKIYRPDGSPDLNRWLVRCDHPGCTHTTRLLGSTDWLIPANPAMPTLCPDDYTTRAYLILVENLYCPDCGMSDLRLWTRQDYPDPGDWPQGWPNFVDCADCGYQLFDDPDSD